MRKRWYFIVAAIIIVILGWRLITQGKNTQSRSQIEIAKVELKTLSETVSSSGKTKANKQVDLKFQMAGQLAWIGVSEGDHVQKSQVIATLDSRELQKNLEKALRDYSKERNDFEEDRRDTYKDKPLTDTIKRILEKNQWDLEKAVLDVELKDIALKWSRLITPIPGVVTHIDTPVAGVYVTTANVMTVADPISIIFAADIDETDIGKMAQGQIAQIRLDAFPDKTFSGKVTKIAFAAETSSGGATVYPVEVSFTETGNIRVGLNGDVTITLRDIPSALSIPYEAIKESRKNESVYVIKKTGKTYEKVTVTTGVETETEVEITSGLIVGDEVVIKGFQQLPKNLQND